MTRLLNANFARLWKTYSFWVCFILVVGLAVANFISSYSLRPICVEQTGSMILSNCMNTALFTTIFAALYLGTDHSNGTIRNKMIIGHTRAEIYLSNLITTAFGGVLMLTVSMLATYAQGLCCGGSLGMPTGELALKIAAALCAVVAVCAICTLLGMLFSSKSTIITLALVLTFALTIGAILIESRLGEPEYISGYELTENGDIKMTDPEPNPYYVSGVTRDVISAVNDILPFGQLMQIEMGGGRNTGLMPLYSLGVIAVTTVAGAVVFRRKDLK